MTHAMSGAHMKSLIHREAHDKRLGAGGEFKPDRSP